MLLLRIAAGISTIARGLTRLGTEMPVGSTIVEILAMAAGILLIAGISVLIVMGAHS